MIAGYVAGMAFGFSDPFWYQAVVAEVWPLSMLLLSLVLCLLLRWFHASEQKRYLIAACFVYGLTLTNSQALALAAPGLALLVVIGNPALGRDGLAAITLLLGASFIAYLFGAFPWILADVVQIDVLGRDYATADTNRSTPWRSRWDWASRQPACLKRSQTSAA